MITPRPPVMLAMLLGLAVAPAQAAPPDSVVADVRRATARYQDIASARADGYVQASGMEARHGYHFVNPLAQARALATGTLELARPPILLYVEQGGAWQLVGVEYALPAPPVVSPLPGAVWHRHAASCHYRDFRETPAAAARACPPRHPESGEPFVAWHPALAVAHVWAWHPNPDGVFAEENRWLAPYGGFTPPRDHHALNPAEIVYSEWTHRAAGAILVVLALATLWERRQARFPWNAVSAPLWVGFGVYLFFSSDPESWPYGPGALRDILGDPLVLQHKLLALLPVVIGVAEALRGAGALRGRARFLVPALAALGGVSLFAHFHDGRFHLDAIYLQHAAMGAVGLGLGVTLLVAARAERTRRWVRWVWPMFLLAMAAVLLLYRET